ncbi:conserved protein, unknown function [Hepatocystis sp. ex Piliocolobus tephrosceles]|nr:conserved protein, unknown function [Hepatocystis sp. ex Piliocolobus tephrosceles]
MNLKKYFCQCLGFVYFSSKQIINHSNKSVIHNSIWTNYTYIATNKNIMSNCDKKKNRYNYSKKNNTRHVKPNYFICIPIETINHVLIDELLKIQNHVINKYDKLEECAIEKNKFHISLLVLHIKPNELDTAKRAFHEAITQIKKINKENIFFKDLATFRNDVLYLCLTEESVTYVTRLVQIIKDSFSKGGIQIVDNKRREGRHGKSATGAGTSVVGDGKSSIGAGTSVVGDGKSNTGDGKSNTGDGTSVTTGNSTIGTHNNEDHDITDSDIIPHLTVMKNSKMLKYYKSKLPKIYPDCYNDFNLSKIHAQQLTKHKIQFLMMDIDSTTSYYKIISEEIID